MPGCGMKLSAPGGHVLASGFDSDDDQRLGHRRIGLFRLACCLRQDVRWRSRSSSSEPLAQVEQGLGQRRLQPTLPGRLGH